MKKKIFIFITASLIFWNICLCCSAAKKVLVVYYSVTGNTKQMAQAAAEGASSVKGVVVKLLSVKEAKAADALWADAIILGTPVYNANAAPALLKYIHSWPLSRFW